MLAWAGVYYGFCGLASTKCRARKKNDIFLIACRL